MGTPNRFEQLRILVIDDDEAMRHLVRRLLARLGVKSIVDVESGEQGLGHIESAPSAIDLIICDWHMREMSGLDIFKKLKARKLDIPFMMLTGSAGRGSIIEAKNAGVRAYLVKPVSPRDLETKIAALTKGGVT
jgi:two-component system, chemotaxis family, chemotaxis protein CheY